MLTMLAAAAAAPPTSYRALGTEPFWNVVIQGREARVSEPDRSDVVLLVRPVASARGWRWRSPVITVDTEREECSDGMSDRRYPDRVTVTYRGRTWQGCGAAAEGSAALAGTAWHVVAIDGRATRLPRPAALRFTGDRIEGFGGCNRFGGSYALERDRLTPGALVSTRMACAGAGMATETRLMAILGGPSRVMRPGEDRLVIRGDKGTVTLRRE